MKLFKAHLHNEHSMAKGSLWWPEQARKGEECERHIDDRVTESQRAGSGQHGESYMQAS